MAEAKKKNTVTESSSAEKLNKARAEFDKYRQRSRAKQEPSPGPLPDPRMAGFRGYPGAMPMGGPVPPYYGFPQQPMPGRYPEFPAMPPGAQNPFTGQGPFFENVGKMLNMGVMFATHAFAGGMQMLQGFYGTSPMGAHGSGCSDRHGFGNHGEAERCDCDMGRTDDRDCCGGDHDCCCSPGVHGCEC